MESDSDEKEVLSQTWSKLQRSLQQEGYREGSSAGRDSVFQKGFDSGYLQGFHVGYRLGLHNGILKFLCSHVSNVDSTVKEHLSTVQPFEKPSRGLCVVCPEEKVAKNLNIGTEEDIDQNVKQVAEVVQKQKNALVVAEKSIFKEEYLLILRNNKLDTLFDHS